MNILLIIFIMLSGSNEPTPKKVYEYCVKQDIKYPEIVTAQAIWETGWFGCDHCSLDKNNIFGFYYNGSYVKFDTWQASVDYYKRWQDTYYDPTRNYYKFLACIYETKSGRCVKYCEDPITYNKCLKKTILRHKKDWVANY
jgi:hypothetical protein